MKVVMLTAFMHVPCSLCLSSDGWWRQEEEEDLGGAVLSAVNLLVLLLLLKCSFLHCHRCSHCCSAMMALE